MNHISVWIPRTDYPPLGSPTFLADLLRLRQSAVWKMWFIETTSYDLVDIADIGVASGFKYAILSHTWLPDGEVTFRDMEDPRRARGKLGWEKIQKVCEMAKVLGIQHVWIDTCCIDKSSSAELTETINSMFNLYKHATICFAYLHDLVPRAVLGSKEAETVLDLQQCRWFRRGWTLQELIAPRDIIFHDRAWAERGTKQTLRNVLSLITGIPVSVIENSSIMYSLPVAQRMSWAAERQTTRPEDTAYALLGIFDVNMSLIYGEGPKAFLRLQEVIAQQVDDLSLFAWTIDPLDDEAKQLYHGMFASSPRHFTRCRHIIPNVDPMIAQKLYFTLTNKGLQLETVLHRRPKGDFSINLNVSGPDGILLLRLVKSVDGYIRHDADKALFVEEPDYERLWAGQTTTITVPRYITKDQSRQFETRYDESIWFKVESDIESFCSLRPRQLSELDLPHAWDGVRKMFLTGCRREFIGLLQFDIHTIRGSRLLPQSITIFCGFDPQGRFGKMTGSQEQLSPWVTLYYGDEIPKTIYGPQGHSTAIHKLMKKEKDYDYIELALRIGGAVRKDFVNGCQLPTYLRLLGTTLRPQHTSDNTGQEEENLDSLNDMIVSLSISSKPQEDFSLRLHEVTIRVMRSKK